MRKLLFKGQKWFLRPHYPRSKDVFILKSGLRFLRVCIELGFWEAVSLGDKNEVAFKKIVPRTKQRTDLSGDHIIGGN